MALTLSQGAQMVADAGYQSRIRSGMIRYAVTVMAEAIGAMTTSVFVARKRLAVKILNNPNGWASQFVEMVASDPGGSLTLYAPTLIASSTNAAPCVVTTSAVHGLAVGDVVEIAGHLVNTSANGVWTVSVVGSTTTFTLPVPANGVGGATGTATKMETDVNINFTIQNNYNAVAGTYTGSTE